MRLTSFSSPEGIRAETIRRIANVIVPLFAAVTVYGNLVCDTGCTYLHGALFGVDLNYLGLLLAAAILLFSLPLKSGQYRDVSRHARTNLLSMAVGGGAVLLHFQAANQIFCFFCLLYGALVFLLFLLNLNRTNRGALAASFFAGVLIFSLFFEGSALPLYSF